MAAISGGLRGRCNLCGLMMLSVNNAGNIGKEEFVRRKVLIFSVIEGCNMLKRNVEDYQILLKGMVGGRSITHSRITKATKTSNLFNVKVCKDAVVVKI